MVVDTGNWSVRELLEQENGSDPDRPPWIDSTIQYEAVVGSRAYGAETEGSDLDVVGVCVPPAEIVFPHLAGEIPGFGRQKKRFDNWECHGEMEVEERDLDVDVFNIVKFFQTCMEANPKWLEALFVPSRCVLRSSPVAEEMRRNRHLFLSRKCFYTFTGYARSQIAKLEKRDRSRSRLLKYGYHAVRLVLELRDVLEEGRLRLDDHADTLREIREGSWSFDRIEEFVAERESELEEIGPEEAAVPDRPPEGEIRELLLDCLEMEYGDLEGKVVR